MAISRTHVDLQVYRPSVHALKDTCITPRLKFKKLFELCSALLTAWLDVLFFNCLLFED